jgi:hypothetical protein
MKRKPIAIKKKDYSRVLLTELLPYELPVFFSNYKLHAFHADLPENVPTLLKKLLGLIEPHRFTIPYAYKIERGDGRQRSLAIMHPGTQLRFVEFYAKWDGYILNQCAKSDFSLRHPVHVGSVYYESHLKNETPLLGDDAGDLAPHSDAEQRTHASSYFYYARYNQIWKFFDSTEFRRIEQDFRSLRRLDVSKCFQSIYTHSISWAVKSKAFAKKHINALTFDKAFDDLMQSSNWSETNGIIIGPEVSRIFAEIILQQIDADIKKELLRLDVLPGKACIRRYVDDYLVFYSSDETGLLIQSVIERCLENYKLSLNDAKTEVLHSPLITSLSIARDAVQDLLKDRIANLFNWVTDDERVDGALVTAPAKPVNERSADLVIRALKGTIKTHSASYSTISPYALGIVSKVLHRALRRLSRADVERQNAHTLYMTLSHVLDVAFFLYRMDVRVNTTYKIASILVAASQIADKFGSVGKIVKQEIIDHGSSVLRQARQAAIGTCEISSLLACLFFVGGDNAVSPDELAASLQLDVDNKRSSYFEIVTALYCARDKSAYAQVRNAACQAARSYFSTAGSDFHQESEAALLFLDIISCPYVDSETKDLAIDAMATAIDGNRPQANEVNRIKKFVGKHLGFCDWELTDELPLMLRRKELKPAYD